MRILALFVFTVSFSLPLVAKNVAIIGGGMAGVSAAAFLKDSGHHVHLFESQASLGGNAQTVFVKNGEGVTVPVDIGPQYFAPGPWDIYIDFLKYFRLYKEPRMIEFDTSIVISQKKQSWPILATPRTLFSHLAINLCHENVCSLKALKDLMDESRKLYEASIPNRSLTVGAWLSGVQFDNAKKERVFLPFLASILGTTIEQTKALSAASLAQLYAFRAPTLCAGSKFSISTVGMGEMIKRLGQRLKGEGVHISTSAEVSHLSKQGSGYLIKLANGNEYSFDAVIAATHPLELAKMLTPGAFAAQLTSLPYIDARVVLHLDHSATFVNRAYPAHFNIMIDENGEVMTTMNLSEIDELTFSGILKSWVNADHVYENMKHVLKTANFQHPLMTPYFLDTVDAIKENIKKDAYGLGTDFAIAGGWTQLHETQNTAIVSALEAVTKLNLLTKNELQAWDQRLKLN